MRETKLKSSKGITLIALVITIIVLLILAGVAISMLSGDNGILKQAANAKTEQEIAQKNEETALTDMEVITDFNTSGKSINYKFKNGFLTGIKVDENGQAESVESVKNKLPKVYEIYNIDASEITDRTGAVTNGMLIKKENKTVGRVVIFGDINCTGKIDIADLDGFSSSDVSIFNNYENYKKAAMDLNGDKIINIQDRDILSSYCLDIETIDQNVYASNTNDLVFKRILNSKGDAISDYESNIPESFNEAGLNFEERTSGRVTYTFMTGVTAGMKIEDILNVLPKDITQIKDENGNVVTSGDVSTNEESYYTIYINNPDYGQLVEYASFWIE